MIKHIFNDKQTAAYNRCIWDYVMPGEYERDYNIIMRNKQGLAVEQNARWTHTRLPPSTQGSLNEATERLITVNVF